MKDTVPKFTGVYLHKEEIVLAGYSTLVFVDSKSLEISKVVSSKYFNDLHEITGDGEDLYLCNTGFSNVVRYPLNSKIKEQEKNSDIPPVIYGENYLDNLVDEHKRMPFAARKKNPGYKHLNSLKIIEDKIFTNDLDNGISVIDKYSDQVIASAKNPPSSRTHDIVISDGQLISTSVDGCLIFRKLDDLTTYRLYRISKDTVFLKNGWCRGLMVDEDIFFVGYTLFNKKNSFHALTHKSSHLKIFRLSEKPIILNMDVFFRRNITSIYSIKKIGLSDE